MNRRLLLEGAKGSKVALRLEHGFDGGRTERSDQLVLQVLHTNVEAQPFHIDTGDVRAEAGPLETAAEHLLLARVTETGQPHVRLLRAEASQEAPYRLRAPDRNHRNALPVEIPTAARGEALEGDLVADSFDEHDHTRVAEPRKRPSRRLRTPVRHGIDPHAWSRALLISVCAALHCGSRLTSCRRHFRVSIRGEASLERTVNPWYATRVAGRL
jgi:hypothetical protein